MSFDTIIYSLVAPLFLSMVFATLLHGISILQTWYYYTTQNDEWPLKSLVAAVMVCNTIHHAMIIHTVYMYGVSYWGDITRAFNVVWSLVIQTVVGGLTAFLVQSFMISRLWRLSNRNIFLLIFTSMIALSQVVSAIAFGTAAVQCETLVQLMELRPRSCAVITLAAVGDVIIAGALCFVLHRSRTGWKGSDTMIRKIMVFTINTGLVTSLSATASFIAYLASPLTATYVGFYIPVTRLYTNAFLATLNARKMLRANANNIHTSSNLAGKDSKAARL